MPLRLLAIGDMHLGRPASKLPQELVSRAHELNAVAAWLNTVDLAIESGVDVVALAGDLIDQEDNLFEAYRPLELGTRKLVDAGIEVVGVSGNHDVKALPRLAESLDAFKLLGAGGRWETHEISKHGQNLTLHGWSFPTVVVRDNPLQGHNFITGPGINLGLLHCDRDQSDSRYAPVSSQSLVNAGLDGWLLGHIHKPDHLSKDNLSGYLGSIAGLHVGEQGPRGPWLIEINKGKIEQVTQWQVAPLLWIHLSLDVSHLSHSSDCFELVNEEIRRLDDQHAKAMNPPHAIGLRLELTGESDISEEIEQFLVDRQGENIAFGEIEYVFIESVTDRTSATVNLHHVAQQADQMGYLAEQLLLLENHASSEEALALVKDARSALSTTANHTRWQPLEELRLSDEHIIERLKINGHRLLRELIRQRQDQSE